MTNNEQYYPTPANLIERLLDKINFSHINNILKPSAGTGHQSTLLPIYTVLSSEAVPAYTA